MVRGRFLVMRYGTLIGRQDGRRLVAVRSRHWTADAALEAAKRERTGRDCRVGGWHVWVVAVGKPAHLPQGRRRSSNFPSNTN